MYSKTGRTGFKNIINEIMITIFFIVQMYFKIVSISYDFNHTLLIYNYCFCVKKTTAKILINLPDAFLIGIPFGKVINKLYLCSILYKDCPSCANFIIILVLHQNNGLFFLRKSEVKPSLEIVIKRLSAMSN